MKKIVNQITCNPIYFILLVALVIRIIYLVTYSGLTEWDMFTVDTGFHHRWAQSIADGNIFGDDIYIRGPLYIYLLGMCYAVFGATIWIGKILGLVIGLATTVVVYKLGMRLYGKSAAVIASLFYSLYPIAIYFEGELLADSLFTLLLTMSILLLIYAVDKKTLKSVVWVGVIFGLAAITRPIILGLLPIFLIWYLNSIWKQDRKWISVVVFFISIMAVIAPVTIRNLVVGGEPVLVASSGGINFYIGNNPEADGLTAKFPPMGSNWSMGEVKSLAEVYTGKKLNWSEVSDYWYGQSYDWIGSNFGDFASLYIKKLYHFVNNYEISNNRFLSSFFNNFTILKYNPISFGLLFMIAIWGATIVALSGKWRKEESLMILIIIVYIALISLFFVNARFRLPIIPIIIIIASAGLEKMQGVKSYKKLIVPAIVTILAGILTFGNLYGFDKNTNLAEYFSQANNHLKLGEYDKAIADYLEIISRKNDFKGANLNLGVAYSLSKQPDMALKYLDAELRHYPNSAEAFSAKAAHYLAYNNIPEAIRAGNYALGVDPDNYELHLPLVRSISHEGDVNHLNELIDYYERKADLPPFLKLEIGNSFSGMKVYDKANEYYHEVIHSNDQPIETAEWTVSNLANYYGDIKSIKSRASLELGYIHGLGNRFDSSVYYNRQAIGYDSANVNAYINLINAYVISGDRASARKLIEESIIRFPNQNAIFERMKKSL